MEAAGQEPSPPEPPPSPGSPGTAGRQRTQPGAPLAPQPLPTAARVTAGAPFPGPDRYSCRTQVPARRAPGLRSRPGAARRPARSVSGTGEAAAVGGEEPLPRERDPRHQDSAPAIFAPGSSRCGRGGAGRVPGAAIFVRGSAHSEALGAAIFVKGSAHSEA